MTECNFLAGDNEHGGLRISLDRRGLLKLGVVALIGGILPRSAAGAPIRSQAPKRSLSFYHTHTGERLRATYWENGSYVREALQEIDHVLRDHRTDKVRKIDTELLDLLFALRNRLEISEPFHVISGYRSASTNAALRSASSGVAKRSLHVLGKAIDIRAPGRELSALHRAAVALKGGGVGYYVKSDFVHLDVGRVRYW